jgi:LysR family hydrogen peroxide-inducible transcriptional activator
VAVVEQTSFSRAAVRCHTSQSNLSEQIKKLEDQLGATLLNRNHRRIVPTVEGELLLLRARPILELIAATKAEIRNADSLKTGQVSFGVLPTIAPDFLAGLLDTFVERWPKIQVCVHENLAEQSLHLIETGKLDMGLVRLPVREHGFETETLFHEEMLLALHTSHPLTRKRAIFMNDLVSEKFILSQEDHCLGDCVQGLCQQRNFHPRLVFQSGQFDTIQSLVAAGKGISLIPQSAIGKAQPTIAYRKLEDANPKRSIAIVMRNKRPLKSVAQEFLKHLRQAGKNFAAKQLKN